MNKLVHYEEDRRRKEDMRKLGVLTMKEEQVGRTEDNHICIWSQPRHLPHNPKTTKVFSIGGSMHVLNRQNSYQGANISLLEVLDSGERRYLHLSKDQFLQSIAESKLPLRDVRMLLRSVEPGAKSKFPYILPRPSSKCFMFEVEHIKLLCFSNKCLIFNPDHQGTRSFIDQLNVQFTKQLSVESTDATNQKDNYAGDCLERGFERNIEFEHNILESALRNVVNKFKRHLRIKRPALEMLLQQTEQNPKTNGLKRLLAVKKSLAVFEQRVEQVTKVVQHLLTDEQDLIDLYLTKPERKIDNNEEVRLLFEAYAADLDEIETETKIFKDMIEDTDQFISAHLDSVRNEIIKLTLFIEIGALVMASGAVVSGIFGMNLANKMEEDNYAFSLVCLGILLMMIGFFAGLFKKYYQLKTDTSSAHSFTLLRNFFTNVDDIEYHVLHKKTLNAQDFKEAVEKLTNLKISDKENEYLFAIFDANNDGVIDTEEELNIHIVEK